MTQSIKYLEGSFSRANKHRADFLFLLRLKSAYNQGFIKDSLSIIGSKIGESKQTVRNRLQGLVKLSYATPIIKDDKVIAYQLISYTELYKSLDYKLKSGDLGFKGSYTFFKVPVTKSTSKKDLQNIIIAYDAIRHRGRMTLKYSEKNKEEGKETCKRKNNSVFLPLSCHGTSKVMGYKSTRKGMQIQKMLENMNVLHIERSSKCVGRFHGLDYKRLKERPFYFGDTARFKSDKDGYGFVWEKECNKVKVNSFLPLLPDNLQNPKDKDFAKKAKSYLGFN